MQYLQVGRWRYLNRKDAENKEIDNLRLGFFFFAPLFLVKIITNYLFCRFLQIARRLLGKILIDLHNTRREIAAIAAESITCHDQKIVSSIKQKERCYYGNVRNEGFERSSTDQKSVDLDSHKETKYCLDPK
jgi:hypothetical protein